MSGETMRRRVRAWHVFISALCVVDVMILFMCLMFATGQAWGHGWAVALVQSFWLAPLVFHHIIDRMRQGQKHMDDALGRRWP